MLKDQLSVAVDENGVGSSRGAFASGSLRLDRSVNSCPSQRLAVSHGGCGNMDGTWDTRLINVDTEGLENFSYGMYNDSASLPFHGHGHSSQMAPRSFASYSTPSLAVNCHEQLHNVREPAGFDTPYCQQLCSPNNPNVTSRTSVSSSRFPLTINSQGDGSTFGSQQTYLPTVESFCTGSNFMGSIERSKYLHQGSAWTDSSGLWSDWSKFHNGNDSLMHLSSTAAAPKPINILGFPGNHFGAASQHKDLFFGYGTRLASSYKGYSQSHSNQISAYTAFSSSLFGTNTQSWPTLHEARQGGRCIDVSCSCNAALDTLGERNRGPRAFRSRSQTIANSSAIDSHGTTVSDPYAKSCDGLDFVTDYKEAKFYVIKSYSEDNVHKSIKYGVWASTPNGNKKLDAAYREAKEKHKTCPVFLLFSVNASAQFCGVAEMVGPVDFDRSVDYWQQDKWSGQFPVKWHIIKDVPNSQFRHIVLANNDNKPVTNSRDTQEVELEHGIEILKIFKNYKNHSSILDDFTFYEERQKATQARKSRHQTAPLAQDSNRVSVSNSSDLIRKLSKSFAEAISLTENGGNFPVSPLAIGIEHEERN